MLTPPPSGIVVGYRAMLVLDRQSQFACQIALMMVNVAIAALPLKGMNIKACERVRLQEDRSHNRKDCYGVVYSAGRRSRLVDIQMRGVGRSV
jgi:hypothetical protein